MKLAFIVQRYGREILGGSETLARQLAERLSRRHEITVLTTTAQDYITWANVYEPGEEKLRGVRVVRFPVVGERNLEEFNKFSEQVYGGNATREQELEWLERQGPVAPELVKYLEKEHHRFDLLIFFTYLYYPTYHGLSVAPEKSVLVPTAHDEPPLRLGIFREMFQLPSSFIFNTEAEELLVLERFPVHKKMRETVGMGMELLDQPDPSSFRDKHDIPGKYLLYAGRIDAGKGLEELFRYFTFYKEEYPASGNFQLILIGKLGMKLPEDASIRYIGFVDEADKLSAMAGALAVVQPSRMESLSIVTLEAFSVGTPVLVNADSRVLIDHCKRSNAGFYYGDFEEFEEILNLLFSERNLARSLGRNGQRYIKDHFGWSKLLAKYELVFRASARPSREPRASKRGTSATTPEPEIALKAERREEAAEAEGAEDQSPHDEAVEAEDAVSEAPEPETIEDEAPVHEPSEAPDETREERPREDESIPATGESPPAELAPSETLTTIESSGAEEPAAVPPDEPDEPEAEDGELAHLPSFYRSSVPPKPPAPQPARAEGVETPPPGGEAAAATHSSPEEPKHEKRREVEQEPLEEGELPAFYRPRPKGSDGE